MKSLGQEILGVDLNFFKTSSKIEYERGERKKKIKGYMRHSGNNYATHTAVRGGNIETIWLPPWK
jgi:hypothetical protein